MKEPEINCPLSQKEVIEQYFMEHRAKLLDIAAFLDRLDRAEGDDAVSDFRIKALKDGLALLDDGQCSRVRRLLELFSDPTAKPRESAAGMKGASGVWPHYKAEGGAE